MFTKEQIAGKLVTDQKWLERGIIAIHARQTADEQDAGVTKYDNSMGWSGADSGFGSYLAKYIKNSRKPVGTILSGKYIGMAQRLMKKYAGQLVLVANANAPIPAMAKVETVIEPTPELVAVSTDAAMDHDLGEVDISEFGF